ncbi:MAG: ATP synthase F1 subunit delta [Phycisphaerales bacterium]
MPLIETPPDALADVYAKSLYRLADEAGGHEAVGGALDELEAVMELARGDARFGEFLASRVLSVKDRARSLKAIFDGRIDPRTLRFLQVLNLKGRLSHLPAIVAALDRLVQEKFGRVEVDVTTAAPMSADDLRSITARLQTALGREPVVHPYTDVSMIGGVRIQIGDRLIDASVATGLRRMRDTIADAGAARLRDRAERIIDDVAGAGLIPGDHPITVEPKPGATAGARPAASRAGVAPMQPVAPSRSYKTGKKTIASVNVAGQRVLIRVDFNVPMDEGGDGAITDDRRIREAVATIRGVVDRGGRAILMSHMGRPEGNGFEAEFSLRPCAERLGELLGRPVAFPSNDCADDAAANGVRAMKDGGVVLLENLRFHKGEKKGDAVFAMKLASLGDVYVNDAFGTCHRPDASMVAVPRAMAGRPRVIGFLVEKEIAFLSRALQSPAKPFVVVLGGAKVSDKLGAIEHLLPKADAVLIGGAMAYTFLKALGKEVGESKVETAKLADAKRALDLAGKLKADLHLPKDHICSTAFAETGGQIEIFRDTIRPGFLGLDIGPATQAEYAAVLAKAKTIVWNGPMGVFEWMPFKVGTQQVAMAIADATGRGATSIVGGGDSAAAVEAFGLAERITHVSTGGGASLEMLEGKKFESVELLDNE